MDVHTDDMSEMLLVLHAISEKYLMICYGINIDVLSMNQWL